MVKRMLIDATHPEETRVAVINETKLIEYEGESVSKKALKGNVYLAKIVRVEPSLQAAFVEYGGNRHGFLPFSEIHPDYFRIPISDREKLLEQERESAKADTDETDSESPMSSGDIDASDEKSQMKPRALHRKYKIQEVINKGQIVLVQVVKEERGGKGAALTTFLSLPGRYCVLMPNAIRSAGISRKITNSADRKRLKNIVEEFKLPDTMGAIIRTAGLERKKQEIKRDLTYLLKLWNSIREKTLTSVAPDLIYEEGDIIQRALRDIYTHEMEEVLVEGKDAYKKAKDLMKQLIPSHAKRVQQVGKEEQALFQKFNIHSQIDAMVDSVVPLPSGGYLIMNITEALVAIDVNSGKSTKDRNIEETAYRTNMEAAEEVARQLRLRDMAGIVVVDFIDMSENKNINSVENKFREFIKQDRARIQVGHISMFGLLELSRQRLRPSLVETASHRCSACEGTGMVRSVESAALQALRALDSQGSSLASQEGQLTTRIVLCVPHDVAYYILNQKRKELAYIEEKYNLFIQIKEDSDLRSYHYRLLTDKEAVDEDQQREKALKSKIESVEKSMKLMRPEKSNKKSASRHLSKNKRSGKQSDNKNRQIEEKKNSRKRRGRGGKGDKKLASDDNKALKPEENMDKGRNITSSSKDPFVVHDIEENTSSSIVLEENKDKKSSKVERKPSSKKKFDRSKVVKEEVSGEEKKKGWLQRLLEV